MHTDPTSGYKYRWDGQQWQPVAPAQAGPTPSPSTKGFWRQPWVLPTGVGILALVAGFFIGQATKSTKTTAAPVVAATSEATSSLPASSAPPTSAAATSASPAPESDQVRFGQAFTWEDGLSVKVSPGAAFTPSPYAAADKAAAYLAFTITVVNNTKKPYDPALFSATVQSSNTEASTVFDSEAGLLGPPSTTLLAGRQSVFKLATST